MLLKKIESKYVAKNVAKRKLSKIFNVAILIQ